jgi:hypothetical protein
MFIDIGFYVSIFQLFAVFYEYVLLMLKKTL